MDFSRLRQFFAPRPAPRHKGLVRRAFTVLVPTVAVVLLVGLVWQWNVIWPNIQGMIAQASGAQVEQILVEGVTHTDKADLAEALGLNKGDPLVTFNTMAARARLEELPWVRAVTVERRLPDTVKVDVYEHEPLARVEDGEVQWLVTKNGDRIVEATDEFNALPLLTGAGAAEEAAALFALLQQKPHFLSQLKSAARMGERRWDVTFQSGVTVMLPENGAAQAIELLDELNTKRHILTLAGGEVDLRLQDRVTLRIPEDAEAGAVTGSRASTQMSSPTTATITGGQP